MAIPATLLAATGAADVQFNGDRPWDLQVHRRQFYGELLRNGSLALGDGYVRGDWDCDHLSEMISRLLKSGANRPLALQGRLVESIQWLSDQILNPQGITQSLRVGRRHYDIDPRVYEAMLGPSMAYSCGYWRHATNLDDAQEAKLHLVCKKLELKPGDRLLDVGCGWGALARVASQHYGAEVVAITISNRQASYIREKFSDAPITVGVCDYRSLPQLNLEPFDKVASIGMFEHVGRRNDRTFHQVMNDCLNPEGLMLLHTIGSASTTHRTDRWIDTHIFPGGRLPSAMQLCKGLEGILLIEDWESFGKDYERTLLSWWGNFELAWPRLCQEIGQDFYRFWRYYLLSCAGYFRSRQGQLWQLVLSRAERESTYRSIRPSSDEWISTSSLQDAADSGQECCIN